MGGGGELAAWEAARSSSRGGGWPPGVLQSRHARPEEAWGPSMGAELWRGRGEAWGASMGAELWRVAKGVGTLGMLAHARDRAVAEARQAEVHGARLAEHTVGGVWCGEWCVVW